MMLKDSQLEHPRPIPQPRASSRRIPGWIEPAAVTLFFTLLTLAMTWPWALHMTEAINPFGDVVVQMTSLQWNAHALLTNPFGLFEAPFFYPYAHSLAFSENLIGETLTGLPALWLFGNPALAGNIHILLSYVLTGLFTYLLVRDLTGSRAAGLLSGVAFAFCQFRFMQMGHLHMLATQWFPFTLWAIGRGLGSIKPLRDPQRWGFSTAYIAWAAFGFIAMGLSSVYYTYFLALAVILYVLWWLAVDARGSGVAWGPLLLRLGAAGAVVAVVLGPVFWPYLQSNRELGFSRSIYEVQNWQAELSYFGNVLQANWLYGKVLAPNMISIAGERELFPGIVPCMLALVGLVWGRGRGRFFYLVLGLFSLVLTFGLSRHIPGTQIELPLPYAFFYDWVPGFKALRVPVRFAVLVDFSLYVLAGYGLARVVLAGSGAAARTRFLSLKGERWPVALALTVLVLLEFINPLDVSNRRDVVGLLNTTEPYGWLARPGNGGTVLELPMAADQNDVWYTFFETRHWQPLVNGFSSFVPPGTVYIKQALATFPDPVSLSLLQGLEVRHVVVHLWQYPKDRQGPLQSKLNKTRELKLVDQAGDNYVYELASNPWLREISKQVGNGTLWVGEARHGSMPTLEVLAYTLQWWGLKPEQIGGNIDIGYRPIGTLPFGRPADYAILPNVPGAGDVPFSMEKMQPVEQNAAVRFLKRDPAVVSSYDMALSGAPALDANGLSMSVGNSGITFGNNRAASSMGGNGKRTVDLTFVAFAPSEVAVSANGQAGNGSHKLAIPAGISHFSLDEQSTPANIALSRISGDARLLRIDLRSGPVAGGQGVDFYSNLMPMQVASSTGGDNLLTSVKVVPPKGEDFTATVDVYVEPWGTHPDGHFGSWSVKVPADGQSHEYVFKLAPLAKTVTTTRDGQPVETFGWVGPPTQGDFRASLSIARGDKTISNTPLYLFTLKGGRLTNSDIDPGGLVIIHPAGK